MQTMGPIAAQPVVSVSVRMIMRINYAQNRTDTLLTERAIRSGLIPAEEQLFPATFRATVVQHKCEKLAHSTFPQKPPLQIREPANKRSWAGT